MLEKLWSGPASIRGPSAFQADALPTELPDRAPPARGRGTVAVLTGFEPATSGLTGQRALQTAPQDREGPVATVHFVESNSMAKEAQPVSAPKNLRPAPIWELPVKPIPRLMLG